MPSLMDELRQMVADEELRRRRLCESRVSVIFHDADGTTQLRDGDTPPEHLSDGDTLVHLTFTPPDPDALAKLDRRIEAQPATRKPSTRSRPRGLSKASPPASGGTTT